MKTCKAGADPSSPAQPLLSASNEIQHPANQLQAWPCSCKFHTLVFATSHRAATHNTEPKPPSLLCSFMPLILGGFHGCSHTQPQNEVAGLSGFLPYPKNGSLQVSLMDVEIHSHRRSLVSVVTASECLPLCNNSFRGRKGFCCAEGNSFTKYLALWFHSKSERSRAARKHFQIPRQPEPKAGQLAGCPGL